MRSILFIIMMFMLRTHRSKHEQGHHLRNPMTKIGTISAILCPFICFLDLSIWFLIFICILQSTFLFLIPRWESWLKLRNANAFCLSVLMKLSLRMRSGSSFRAGLENLLHEEKDPFWKQWLEQMYGDVVFSQQKRREKNEDLKSLREFVLKCDKDPHQQLEQLQIFRSFKQKQSEFRRKSGQALAQMRTQSLLLVVMHFAILAFMSFQFGWEAYQEMYLASIGLMVLGAGFLLKMGKKTKWKV